jgi:hypothetical protein
MTHRLNSQRMEVRFALAPPNTLPVRDEAVPDFWSTDLHPVAPLLTSHGVGVMERNDDASRSP